MKHSNGALFATITASLLTACGAGNTTYFPAAGSSCGPPPVQMQMLHPIPNSRRAPTDLGKVYVATNGQLQHADAYNFFLVQSNGSSTATSRFFGVSKSEIPTPHAKIPYANAFYYATSIASRYTIGRNQAVNLYWNIPGTGCAAHTLVSSFRTRRTRS